MRAVIQRVTRASVTVQGQIVGQIDTGLAVLVGITYDDEPEQVAKLARKITQLKILRDSSGSDEPKQRVDVVQAGASVLLVSQFTLYANANKGTKPSWTHAAPGKIAQPLFDTLVAEVAKYGIAVQTGQFGAMMDVEIHNDGPFTIILDI
ncbi:D-aminoacyl-tRNA deacylase [Arcanobacterium buesumense]|uniref:D-aminoacyl-tRNA deacylase n=1 Tax=Arcanobacterium buesumense TaxID=2722751 RepID=A0A6H2EKM0_9ACTO|nr:D-aminoacyl-tRNA deacylase [Arcanobacterium buesumense]QJC21257.1 D-tyrosyl-tRNA(Tyr) deacylase [Arcanobacterium buesumense]